MPFEDPTTADTPQPIRPGRWNLLATLMLGPAIAALTLTGISLLEDGLAIAGHAMSGAGLLLFLFALVGRFLLRPNMLGLLYVLSLAGNYWTAVQVMPWLQSMGLAVWVAIPVASVVPYLAFIGLCVLSLRLFLSPARR